MNFNEHKLTISKIIAQIDLAHRAGNSPQPLWHAAASRPDVTFDVEQMFLENDLESVSLELLDGNMVVYALTFRFTGRRIHTDGGLDLARGLELPVLSHLRVTGHRLIVHRRTVALAYPQKLRLKWSTANKIPLANGGVFGSDHTTAISGGRLTGCLHVSDQARHTMTITHAGHGDFAFGRAASLPKTAVYLHRRFATANLFFKVGAQVSAVVVATPRGLQARDIRLAA